MDDYASGKVSVSVRNALSVNSHKSHQLERQVKNLEAERDMRLLNLQIRRDEVFSTSPSTRRKVLVKSPSVSEGLRSSTPISQHETFDLKTGWRKDEEVGKLQKTRNLPPLMYLDRAGVIATPPRVRKARNIAPTASPNVASSPLSPLESQPNHKLLTRHSSSPQMLSKPNSIANANDLRREETSESKHLLSPRLPRSNPESPALLHSPTSPGVFKFDLAQNQAQLPRRPATATSGESRGSEVHRGLFLMPVTSSKEQTKQKEGKKISVFNRLYSGSKKGKRTPNLSDDLATRREIPFSKGNPKLDLTPRRRSLSLSDLSDIDKLKTCRYLRNNNQLS